MENQPAPEFVIKLITCTFCKSNCTTSCQCRVLSMGYNDVYKCQGLCENIVYDSVESDNDDVEEENENDNADDNA